MDEGDDQTTNVEKPEITAVDLEDSEDEESFHVSRTRGVSNLETKDMSNDEVVAQEQIYKMGAVEEDEKINSDETVPEIVPEVAPETVTEAAPETVTEAAPETVTEAAPETVTEAAPETVTEAAPETVTEAAPETVSEPASETVSEPASETVSEAAPETVSEAAPEAVPETVTETAPETVTEVVPESSKPSDPVIAINDDGKTHDNVDKKVKVKRKRKSSRDNGPGDTISSKFGYMAGKKGITGQWIVSDHKGNCVGEGTGLESLKEVMDETKILFAVLRVEGVDEQERLTSIRPKMVRIDWVGTKTKIKHRRRSLIGKPLVTDAWRGIAYQMSVSSKPDLDAVNIGTGLVNCGGAHKPTHYDFGDTKISLADLGK